MSVYGYLATSRLGRISSLLDPWALRAAATLRLPDLIAEGADTTSELARRSDTDPSALNRLMRHLEILGLFSTTMNGRWKLTELGEFLRDDHPRQIRSSLDQANHYLRKVDQSTYGLLEAIRTGRPIWDKLHGLSFWDDLATDQDLRKGFDELMACRSVRLCSAISQGYDWANVQHVIDVGGGTGNVLASILSLQPDLRGTLVDLPSTVADAAAILERANVADRCVVVGQSFFDMLPYGGDVYLLTNVLHNWSDEKSAKILRRCAEAANKGGRVVLVERVMNDIADENDRSFASGMDLYMLLLIGGQERTDKEFHRLALTAGLQHTATYPLAEYPWMALIEYTVATDSHLV